MTTGGVLLDDHLLLQLLLREEPTGMRTNGQTVATTGLWYHRLCRAVMTPAATGVLSRALGRAEPELGTAVMAAVTELPHDVGLISLRQLAAPMAQLLDDGLRLNLMSLEAIAAAEHLGAEICLAEDDENPLLLAAAAHRGIPTRMMST